MVDLSYSDDAKNVLHKFHRVDAVLYVEGEDDILFWELIFEHFSTVSIHAKELGGKPEVEKYAKKIEQGTAKYLVAMDSDFRIFEGLEKYSNPNILFTAGYAIENTFVCNRTLQKAVHTLSKLSKNAIDPELGKQWLNSFSDSVEKLVLHDIANFIDKSGIGDVVTESCERFFQSQNSCVLCGKKIEEHLLSLKMFVDIDREIKIRNDIRATDLAIVDLLRGHFLFTAAYRFITASVKSLNNAVYMSKDALLATLFIAFETCFGLDHPHYEHYKKGITSVVVPG